MDAKLIKSIDPTNSPMQNRAQAFLCAPRRPHPLPPAQPAPSAPKRPAPC